MDQTSKMASNMGKLKHDPKTDTVSCYNPLHEHFPNVSFKKATALWEGIVLICLVSVNFSSRSLTESYHEKRILLNLRDCLFSWTQKLLSSVFRIPLLINLYSFLLKVKSSQLQNAYCPLTLWILYVYFSCYSVMLFISIMIILQLEINWPANC